MDAASTQAGQGTVGGSRAGSVSPCDMHQICVFMCWGLLGWTYLKNIFWKYLLIRAYVSFFKCYSIFFCVMCIFIDTQLNQVLSQHLLLKNSFDDSFHQSMLRVVERFLVSCPPLVSLGVKSFVCVICMSPLIGDPTVKLMVDNQLAGQTCGGFIWFMRTCL